MKKLFIVSLLFAEAANSWAGAVVGATEPTQIANNIQLVLEYTKQVNQYRTQLEQYQLQLQDLAQNGGGNLNGETTQIIQSVGSIMSAENSMGGTLSQIDGNFAKTYQNPTAATYSERYKTWTDRSMGTLGAALRAAGLHRDSYSSDADALQELYNRSQSSTGTVAAVQQLSALTAMQIQQTQNLGDLMTTQNEAASTWMATQVSQKQEAQTAKENLAAPFKQSLPPMERAQIIDWTSTLKLQN